MKAQVKLFAVARQLAGAESIALELESGATVADLRSAIARDFPQLATVLPHALLAIDNEYAENQDPIAEGAEIGLIPPVSGG